MINAKRLCDLFQELVSIDSPSFGEREMNHFLKSRLASLGIPAQEDDAGGKMSGDSGNLYAYIPGDIDLPPLLFCGHMDTVEPSRGKRAVVDRNGTITSAGNTVLGADDCAALASFLEALTVLHEGKIPHRPIELLLTAAEEPYCTGVRYADFDKIQAKEAYVFDLDGPVGRAALQAPTILSWRLHFTGRSAHAGFAPEEGIHAVKAAAAAIDNIPCGHVGEATVNVGTITGGTATNIVPEQCILTGEIRSFSNQEAQALLADIEVAAGEAAATYGATVQVDHTVHVSAYYTPADHPATRRFQAACRQMQLEPELGKTFGGSDNNILSEHGIIGLVVATAMNNCHSCAEYTTAKELERAANLALALMLSKE